MTDMMTELLLQLKTRQADLDQIERDIRRLERAIAQERVRQFIDDAEIQLKPGDSLLVDQSFYDYLVRGQWSNFALNIYQVDTVFKVTDMWWDDRHGRGVIVDFFNDDGSHLLLYKIAQRMRQAYLESAKGVKG